jgi:hypothetical protein
VGIAAKQGARSVGHAVFPLGTPGAIILAAVIIGLSIVGAALGSRYLEGRYELSTTGNGDTPLGWRLDRRTGAVVVCELAKDPRAIGDDNIFAHLPPVMGARTRTVDKVMVECGYE